MEETKVLIAKEEVEAMKELLFREVNGKSSAPVPRTIAISLEQKGWAKVVSEAPPTFRLTEKGKEILEK